MKGNGGRVRKREEERREAEREGKEERTLLKPDEAEHYATLAWSR